MKPSAAALLLLTAGCAAVRQPEVLHTLRLAPHPAVAAAGPGRAQAVALMPVAASGITAGRRYVYVEQGEPSELKQAATLMWEEPPATVLEAAAREALGPALATPRGAEAAGPLGRRLELRLTRFEETTGGNGPTSAVVAFDAAVGDAPGRRTLFLRAYCARTPVAGPRPSDRARAFEGAVAQAVDHVVQDALTGTPTPSAC